METWEEREIHRITDMIREVREESGAEGLVVGVSGGVDSAVSLALCARAVGPDRVLGLLLPAAVTRGGDMEDARDLCRGLYPGHSPIHNPAGRPSRSHTAGLSSFPADPA